MTRSTYLAAGLALFTAGSLSAADDWPQFRGAGGQAVAKVTGLPDKIGPDENLKWKTALPGRGLSSPVIAGDRIFLTANSGMDQNRLHVLALEMSGKKLWERQFWATGQTLCHPLTCMACPTVATDGRMVFALFATGDLVALTTDGDVRWVRSFPVEHPKMINHVGRSSSPILAGGTLLVLMENQGESYLFGIDPASGTTKWKVERPGQNNWNTPLVLNRGGGTEVVVSSYNDVTAYDVATGAVRWTLEEKTNPIVSPVAADDLVLVPSRGLIALRPSESGAEVVWRGTQLGADTPTPVVHEGKIYTVARGILKCGNLADGKQVWDLRVNGKYSASPVYADGKLFLASEEGNVVVVRPGDKPETLSTAELKEPVLATPAVANGCVFVRTDKHLWCFGRKGG